MNDLLLNFVDLLARAFSLAILGRVIMSWISPSGSDPISVIIYQITEPILQPIRRVLPQMGMLDLSPLVALLILNFIVPRILDALWVA